MAQDWGVVCGMALYIVHWCRAGVMLQSRQRDCGLSSLGHIWNRLLPWTPVPGRKGVSIGQNGVFEPVFDLPDRLGIFQRQWAA